MTSQLTQAPGDLSRVRVIPITKPGSNAFTFALARTDEEVTSVQEKALALGLRPGHAKKIEPNPEVNRLLDFIRRNHR